MRLWRVGFFVEPWSSAALRSLQGWKVTTVDSKAVTNVWIASPLNAS